MKMGSKWTGSEPVKSPDFGKLLAIGVIVLLILAAMGVLGAWVKMLSGPCGIFSIGIGGMLAGTIIIE